MLYAKKDTMSHSDRIYITPTSFGRCVAMTCLLLVLMFTTKGIIADEAVAYISTVKGTAIAVGDTGEVRELEQRSEIFLHDVISTEDRSFAVLIFTDDSVVTIRPASEFSVQDFQYGKDGKYATLNLTRGGLRIITGKISKNNPDNYKLKTPVASMGVRGTRFDARLCEEDCESEERLITDYE